jgi:hypothetical protein
VQPSTARLGFFVRGWVAEWFKAHAWKVCLRQNRNVGSNPTPSVVTATPSRVALARFSRSSNERLCPFCAPGNGLQGLLVGTPTKGGLRYEGVVEFGLSRLGGLRQLCLELATSESPFVGEWTPKPRRFWLRPKTIEIRALPRRPGRRLRHATALRVIT